MPLFDVVARASALTTLIVLATHHMMALIFVKSATQVNLLLSLVIFLVMTYCRFLCFDVENLMSIVRNAYAFDLPLPCLNLVFTL